MFLGFGAKPMFAVTKNLNALMHCNEKKSCLQIKYEL